MADSSRELESEDPRSKYVYRRTLSSRESMTAISVGVGVGAAVGVATFYVMRLFLQRTPLFPSKDRTSTKPASTRTSG